MSDISILQKQNDGIIASLKAKNVAIEYEYNIDETNLEKVRSLNTYLKELSAKNRPPPKPKAEPQPKAEPKAEDDDEDDNLVKEVKPVFQTITNM